MFFTGTVSHQLDGKNRIRIPKRFRAGFPVGETLYFVRYTKGCIAVVTESGLQTRMEDLLAVRSDQTDRMTAKRLILSRIEEVVEDTENRIVLSAAMRTHAGIKKDVLCIGMGDYIEIWAPERFEQETENMPLDEAFRVIPF